jgi:broad specificity phosphatase PhoE
MIETTLGLLRHGQTDWNVAGRLQGTSDIELNEMGVKQAQAAARAINPSEWQVVIASPLLRARATAQCIVDFHQMGSLVIDERFLERAFGEAEGLSYEAWKTMYDPAIGVPGGENLEQLEARARKLLDQIAMEYAGQSVLAVSHGALIRKLVRIASDKELPRDGERFANTSLTKLVHRDGQWQILHYDGHSLAGF